MEDNNFGEEDILHDTGSCKEEQVAGNNPEVLPINLSYSTLPLRNYRDQNKPTVLSIDKVFEHLNKKQKVSFSGFDALDAFDAVDMLMLSHAKTIKSFPLRRQLIAKKKISEIIADLEMKQIEENEESQRFHYHTDSYLKPEVTRDQNSEAYYFTTHTDAKKTAGSFCP